MNVLQVQGSGRHQSVLHSINTSLDSDLDVQPPLKRKKGASMEERLKRLKESMLHNKSVVQEASAQKDQLVKDTQKCFSQLRQCFECLVCKSSVELPALVSPCCSIVLGFEICIEQWLSSSKDYQCRFPSKKDYQREAFVSFVRGMVFTNPRAQISTTLLNSL